MEKPIVTFAFLWLALAGLIGCIAVSDQSLWIDEAHTAVKAMEPEWSGFISRMKTEVGSDAQMPGYMALVWGWEKVVGPSEWGLRALNIPLLILAIGSVVWLGPGDKRFRKLWILFALTSPFLWFYLDEARPYVLQFAASTFILIGLSGEDVSLKRIGFFWIGMPLLCASSLTGVVFAFYFGLAAVWRVGVQWKSQNQDLNKRILLVSGCSVLLLIPLGLYYFYTLLNGVAASSAARTTVESLIFSGYEYLGFLGWGPSRLQLRSESLAALAQFKGVLLIYALLWGSFLGLGVQNFFKRPPENWKEKNPVILACILGALTMLGVGVLGEFRLLGRHFMPLLPFVICVFAWIALRLWDHRRGWIPVLLLLASLGSALSGRFAARHVKDAYREASQIVLEAQQKGWRVWWAADIAAAEYYGVLDDVQIIRTPSFEELMNVPSPNLIFLSKPTIYDAQSTLGDYISSHHYRVVTVLPAFTVWSRDQEAPSTK